MLKLQSPDFSTDMNKQPNLPSAEESKAHYGVPSGYFDTLEDRIMAQIPESQPEEVLPVAKPKLWIRLRPISSELSIPTQLLSR